MRFGVGAAKTNIAQIIVDCQEGFRIEWPSPMLRKVKIFEEALAAAIDSCISIVYPRYASRRCLILIIRINKILS
jgi:hypothetical protein